jgi:hypothetical protein
MRKIVVVSVLVAVVVAATAWAASTPAVVTGAATAVSNTGALLHATVNPAGGATTYRFEYGPTIAYGATSKTGHAPSATKAVSVKEALAGLTPGTLYHYRVDATNRLGSALGRDRTFTTTGHPPPGAVTGVASVASSTIATLTGTVVSQSQTTSTYFQYGTSPTSYAMQTPAVSVSASATPTPVSYTLTGLAPGTTFHYRLVAAHPGGAPEYGADQAFTTIPVKRFSARATAHTTPRRARHKPYLFTTTGAVLPGVALPPGVGCTGVVAVRFLLGHRTVAFRAVSLQPGNCTYSTQVGFRHLIHHATTQLRVVVRFRGNAYLRAAHARTGRVKLG